MDYEGFKKGVFELSGINLDFYKERQMQRRICSLMRKNAYDDFKDYLHALAEDVELYHEFINYLTINVSEFYRNPELWEVLQDEILPGIIERNKMPRIWSCACSTGEEPYTAVMILNSFLPLDRIKIIATDIDMEAISKAKEGLYTSKSIEALPDYYIRRFFREIGDKYAIADEVKKCVEFKRLDLLQDKYPDNCDLIICRNVLIYFTREAKEMIYYKIAESLKREGILFVGSTEQIIMSQKYGLRPIRTFFYTKGQHTDN